MFFRNGGSTKPDSSACARSKRAALLIHWCNPPLPLLAVCGTFSFCPACRASHYARAPPCCMPAVEAGTLRNISPWNWDCFFIFPVMANDQHQIVSRARAVRARPSSDLAVVHHSHSRYAPYRAYVNFCFRISETTTTIRWDSFTNYGAVKKHNRK